MTSAAPTVAAVAAPYVLTHPVGQVWLAVVVVAGAIEIVGAARRRPEATRRDRGSRVVTRLALIPGLLLLVLLPRIAPGAEIEPPLVPVVLGMVIFSLGEALRVWSMLALGRYFTYTVRTSRDQPVITSGPYRIVRHPSYTGILLIVIGVGAASGNWLGLGVVTVMALGGLSYRINVEEKALLEDVGERYRVYAERHKRLIPFVW